MLAVPGMFTADQDGELTIAMDSMRGYPEATSRPKIEDECL